jgi:hypothetical protein
MVCRQAQSHPKQLFSICIRKVKSSQKSRRSKMRTLLSEYRIRGQVQRADSHSRFRVQAPQRGTAFLPCTRWDLDLIFSQPIGR